MDTMNAHDPGRYGTGFNGEPNVDPETPAEEPQAPEANDEEAED
jgi:hypothetical protein